MTYKNKKILAIIPARKGSKGVKNKNTKKLSGKPLIEWSIIHAKESKYIDNIVITTNDEKVVEIGKKEGVKTLLRPENLATDSAPMKDVILHVLKIEKGYDAFVLLQPTSPLRTAEDINRAIERLYSGNYHSCVSICEFIPHPFLAVIKEDNCIKSAFKQKDKYTRRQDFPSIYRINGAIYVLQIEKFLKDPVFIKDSKSTYYEMPVERSIDIDFPLDFKIAELVISELDNT